MTYAESDGASIFFEGFGSPADPTILLIMGLGAQAIAWNSKFCNLIAAEGYYVVRFDNRDVGLSSRTDAPLPRFGPPTVPGTLASVVGKAPYTLADMATDALAVLDAIGVQRAHIVGASLGGMIAQTLAFTYLDRVLSLASIMSTTGHPGVGGASMEAAIGLMTPTPLERGAAIEHGVAASRVTSGPLFDEERVRAYCAARYDRAFNPLGSTFQLAALVADGDRTDRLTGISCPTLVLHGKADTLIDVSGGHATAAAISGARDLVLDEMGHDLPPELWPQIVEAIVDNVRRADRA